MTLIAVADEEALELDAQAWELYKSGRYAEAEQAMVKALTAAAPAPRLLYHAGLIAYAVGKKAEAAKHLKAGISLGLRLTRV